MRASRAEVGLSYDGGVIRYKNASGNLTISGVTHHYVIEAPEGMVFLGVGGEWQLLVQ